MRRTATLLVAVGLFVGFLGTPAILSASCPDYGIICSDNTCHGWYGDCWSWKDLSCVPCSDPGNVCGDAVPKCVSFKGGVFNIIFKIWCDVIHLPSANCEVCTGEFPCSFSAR